jgi:hypothetical protein
MVEEDSLTGRDLIMISEHKRTVSNPAQVIVIPYCSFYWNSNNEDG